MNLQGSTRQEYKSHIGNATKFSRIFHPPPSTHEKKKKTQTQTEAKTRSEDRENDKGKTTQVRRYKMARQKHTHQKHDFGTNK